jgi:hypothetical protein
VRESPDKGFEEHFSSSSLGKRRSWWKRAHRVAVYVKVVSEKGILSIFCSRVEKKNFTMPPRRERQSPDPEDREVRRRGRPTGNLEMERQIRDLRARLEDMEAA